MITFPLDALDSMDPMAGLKRAKRISSHTSFFKAGQCLGRMLVCIVKSSQLSSTFKALEPIDQNVRGRSKPTFRKLLQGGNDTLKPFRVRTLAFDSLRPLTHLYWSRNSISQWNQRQYIISRPRCVLGARGASRLLISRPWTHKAYWIPMMNRSSL